jgi:hypothetical protein
MTLEVNHVMQELFDCPECHRTHAEPAEASLGLRIRCLGCALEEALTDALGGQAFPAAA